MRRTLAAFILIVASAFAAPISYTFTGTGTGSIGTDPFTNAAFVVTINADTSQVAYQPLLTSYGILNLAGTIGISGIGTANFTDPLFFFGGHGSADVGFGYFGPGNLIDVLNAAASTYDLVSNFTFTGPNGNLNQFVGAATNMGALTYTSMSDVTFTAVAGVPEPGCALLAVAGLAVVVLRRRRLNR